MSASFKTILFFFLFFFSLSLVAQKPKMKTFGGGISLGFNFAQVDGDGYGGFKKIGFSGGGFVNYRFTNNQYIKGEIHYSEKGSKSSFRALEARGELFEMILSYIDIPFLYGYHFSNPISIEVGIMPSVLVKGEELINFVSNHADFHLLDLSYVLGLSYKMSSTFSISGRFTYSLMNIRKSGMNQPIRSILGNGQYNQVVAFLLTYEFK